MRPEISLLITDIDNTLHDWLSSFVPSFYAMVRVASGLLDVSEEQLLTELTGLIKAYGSVEHPYMLLDTPSVRARFPRFTRVEVKEALLPAFQEFNVVRDELLHPYPGVIETLMELHSYNVPVVAYTDAPVENSKHRMAKLGVIPLISHLYAPRHAVEPDHPGPLPTYTKAIPDQYVKGLARSDRKPNPKTLLDICADYRVDPALTLYIGDSLTNDISMAQHAGVHNAWAKYGADPNPDLWEQLVRVTHWTRERVSRETQSELLADEVKPEISVDFFADILDVCTFRSLPRVPA